MEKISIIIPTYNNAKYLVRCIDSILNQTYKNIEIIIVDDGSTDNTKDILKKYDYKSINYIYQKNRGVSSARNKGLQNSSGEYIMFLDSDDFYDCNYCKKMLKALINSDSDICISGMKYKYPNFEILKEYYKSDCLFSDKNIINFYDENINNYLLYSACTKIYKRDLLKNVWFDENMKIGEDYIFNLQYLKRCKKIYYISNNYYNYVSNTESATATLKKFNNILTIEKELEFMYRVEELLTEIGVYKKTIKKHKKKSFTNSYHNVCKNIFSIDSPYSKKEKKQIISKLFNSEIGIYTRKNIMSPLFFVLSHSKIITYSFYSLYYKK